MALPVTRRLPAIGLLAVGLAVLPFLRESLGPSTAFVPAVLTAIALCEVLTTALLFGGFLSGGSGPLLGLACAYLFTALITVAHALLLPGAVADTGLWAVDPQVPAWLRAVAHAGLPVAVALALWGGPSTVRRTLTGPTAPRGGAVVLASVVAVLSAALVTTAIVLLGDHLPTISAEGSATGLAVGAGGVVLVLNLIALGFVMRRGRRSVLERRLLAVVALTIAATALTVGAGHRYTLAWYLADLLELVASAMVLTTLMAGAGRMTRWRSADSRASAVDPLTGARTRTATLVAAEHLHAARAPGTPLGLALVDVDGLKAIGDTYGPLAADAVLLTVAKRLRAQLRDDDVLGRSGEEGFIVVLPGADAEGVTLAIDRAVAAIREESVGTWAHDVRTTASGGIAMIGDDEDAVAQALVAADHALNQAKAHGRDQVVSPARAQVVPLRRAVAGPQRG